MRTPERSTRGVGVTVVDAARRRALIVGVGNPYRGDDAVGLLVARQLRAACPPGVRVVETPGEAAELLDVWEGADLVVLIDAVRADAPPGTIYRFEVGVDPMPPVFARRSSHTLGVGEAIALAGALDRLPSRLVVYGIAGQRFGLGESVSPSVQSVLAEVASRALAETVRGAATRSNDGAGEEPADA